jgi:hypothetical protein
MDAELQPHLQNETQVIRHAGREAIRQFLETHNCFAVLRTSGKVVVFDTRIPIQLAFYALVEHGTCPSRLVLEMLIFLLDCFFFFVDLAGGTRSSCSQTFSTSSLPLFVSWMYI